MGEEETDHIQTRLVMFLVAVTKYLTKLLKGGRICFGCWFQKVAVHLSDGSSSTEAEAYGRHSSHRGRPKGEGRLEIGADRTFILSFLLLFQAKPES